MIDKLSLSLDQIDHDSCVIVMITFAYVIRWSNLAAHASCSNLGVRHRVGIDHAQYSRLPGEYLSAAGTIAVTFSGSGMENHKA